MGLIASASLLRMPQEVEAGTDAFAASLDCRNALRDKPGGDASHASFEAGVEGVVPKEAPIKRHL